MRSRAAFKLTQINRKFPILQNAKVVLDLCAAPGGWTQICSRTLPSNSLIVAVDILPIRSLGSNVITLVGDITTDTCKSAIRKELQTAPVDVVLHDGAPNIGASYDKDAYAQNEIALHALKCATQHLRKGGTFVTKLYRSCDYASYVWIVKQFFKEVQAVKPASSRSQSAEIFLVCQDYIAPDTIDPKMLDPKCVFEQVEGETTGGSVESKHFNVFHKQWGKQKRHRSGYDLENMDFKMQTILPVKDFVEGKDAIQLLSQATGFKFHCEVCQDANEEVDCQCQLYLQHPHTTAEVKACVSDLKVLNKSDFKGLLTWRTKMQEALQKKKEALKSKNDVDADSVDASDAEDDTAGATDEQEEEQIQAEIAAMRQRRLRQQKKLKKKERAVAAKRRRRAALGMDLNAVELPEHDEVFSLATITSKGDLEAARQVDLDKVTDEELLGGNDDDEDGVDFGAEQDEDDASQGEPDDLDEETGYSYRLDRELDAAYDRYLSNTKNGLAKSGTKMAKRSKKLQRQKAMEEANEDQELMMANDSMIDRDTETYAKMLQGTKDSDDEDSEDEDDGFHDEPQTPEEHKAKRAKVGSKQANSNPLIYKLPEESTSVKTARWFSNPLFESIGNTAQLAAMTGGVKETIRDGGDVDFESDDEDKEEDEVLDMSSDEEDKQPRKGKREASSRHKKTAEEESSTGLTAEDVLASMPKTDKQIRHEKRLKALERQERKKARRARLAGETGGDFEVAAAASDDDDDKAGDEKLAGLSKEEKKKVLEARALIKAGLGNSADDKSSNQGFEVVAAGASNEAPLPVMDKRAYDSENEDYDSDDYARTLALGTMMLRKSKAKALVDASYNRFAWNDPEDLPDWFVDDENRHYRPQLPIPPELMAKMKEKMLALSTKPIAKVAEARARKNKRAKTKLAAAKKKAEAVANSSEMSETMKLKAISKAMRGQDARKPGKTYVVSKKGRGARGAKGVKFVDKRMRNDKKAMERSMKKKSGGKRGGLTGSKRRRNHS